MQLGCRRDDVTHDRGDLGGVAVQLLDECRGEVEAMDVDALRRKADRVLAQPAPDVEYPVAGADARRGHHGQQLTTVYGVVLRSTVIRGSAGG